MKHLSAYFNKNSRLTRMPVFQESEDTKLPISAPTTLEKKLTDILQIQNDYFPCFDWAFPPPLFSKPSGPKDTAELFSKPSVIPGRYSIYLHIPFCKTLCKFCYYTVMPGRKISELATYVDYLLREMALYSDTLKNKTCESIYLGGGTPTCLNHDLLTKVLNGLKHHFNLAEDAEITIEAAPGTLPREKASLLHKLGVNRISYGIQTLNDKLLSKMNRDYSVKEAIQELEDTIQIIGNINVDTMYGFDGEPDSALTDTLTTFMDIGIPCLSIYALDTQRCVQEKEYFGPAVDELYKKKIELFQRSRELLMKRGFVNLLQNIFLKPGEASYIHQVRRWENLPLVALGISSMGYGPRKPYQNCATLKPYYRHLDEGRPPIVSMEVLSPEMEMAREVSSQLRFTQVNILDILKKYGVDLDLGFHELIDALINLGYLDRVDYKIKLSSEATYYNNVIPMLFSPDSFKEKLMGLPGEYVENFPIPHVLTRLGRTQSASIRVRPYTADS